MKKLIGYLRLTRPANLVTAVADILAGIAMAVFVAQQSVAFSWLDIALLIIATVGLYGGGVVFNDVFDAELDKAERPERPIPSGLIPIKSAVFLGVLLLVAGIGAAVAVHPGNPVSVTAGLAAGIAVFALVYDKWMKHHPVLGPLNMGLCRGMNLLLGMSLFPATIMQYGILALVPVIYIAAVTMISRGEVHGGKRGTLAGAAWLYVIVIVSIVLVAYLNSYLWQSLVYLALFAALVFPPLQKAIRNPVGSGIGKAVKAGVIGLILMNAAWAAAFGMFYLAVVIALLLPVSLLLAKLFAVT